MKYKKESFLSYGHYDLVTPDGCITQINRLSPTSAEATVLIEKILPTFVGFRIDPKRVFFNVKSTLAQLGINGIGKEYMLDSKNGRAEVKVELNAIGQLASIMLEWLQVGSYIGKLFAADETRRVRDPDYLRRMFERSDARGFPLLSLKGTQKIENIEGYTVVFISLLDGVLKYEPTTVGFIPTLAKALYHQEVHTRALLQLDQIWFPEMRRHVQEGELLLVRTPPLHIRTMFGRVAQELLPKGYMHMTASVLEPTTAESGDVYELFGKSEFELIDIPLEFYTLEPYKEYIYFSDRVQLQASLADPAVLFKAFETAPGPENQNAAVYVVKHDQLVDLTAEDWITRESRFMEFPGLTDPERHGLMLEQIIESQVTYPFLKGIEDELITSQGILLVRYFPTPFLKRLLLSNLVQRCLRRIYFQYPSLTYADYFSHEDRSLLHDLAKFAISVYWVEKASGKILEYVPKLNKDAGMFVPLDKTEIFKKMTAFGIYGSNLIAEENFESELTQLLKGLDAMRLEMDHVLFNKDTPLGLVTGGGPGVMELGNRIAKSLNILSCARVVDFRAKSETEPAVNEQRENPYVDAKMTYRLDRLVERQAEFHLDFPIFLRGGIGTDFEFSLEEVLRKIGVAPAHPIILFGDPEYWKDKITSRFQRNMSSGTIAGSEWTSNCLFCIQNAAQGLNIYRSFFSGTLNVGKNGPVYKEGFIIVE